MAGQQLFQRDGAFADDPLDLHDVLELGGSDQQGLEAGDHVTFHADADVEVDELVGDVGGVLGAPVAVVASARSVGNGMPGVCSARASPAGSTAPVCSSTPERPGSIDSPDGLSVSIVGANSAVELESSSLPHAEAPSPTRTINVTAVHVVLFLPMGLRRHPSSIGSTRDNTGQTRVVASTLEVSRQRRGCRRCRR